MDTVNLDLPLLAAAQAQKHVTHNEALLALDTLVQLSVLDRLDAPPGVPDEGDRYLVGATPSGAFASRAGCVAAFQDGGWRFSVPRAGWIAWLASEEAALVHDGSGWSDLKARSAETFGIHASADTSNRLAVASPAVLFSHAGTNAQVKVNKAASADTASLLLQTAFSGRAEIGLAGDDDLHVKVSPDGATWVDAIVVKAANGRIAFPATGGPRELLTGNRSYYVRTDGSDSNDGLANSAGGGFLTLQKAINTVLNGVDLNGFNVTVQVGAGTYTAGLSLGAPWVGAGAVTVRGDTATPGNVVVSTSGDCIRLVDHAVLHVQGLKLVSSSASCILAQAGSNLYVDGNMEYGTATQFHFNIARGSLLVITADYVISGGAAAHWQMGGTSAVVCQNRTVALSGTPAFSVAFANGASTSLVNCTNCTFSGAATGTRYVVQQNSVINTNGAGASYFPGNAAGTTASGGQYA